MLYWIQITVGQWHWSWRKYWCESLNISSGEQGTKGSQCIIQVAKAFVFGEYKHGKLFNKTVLNTVLDNGGCKKDRFESRQHENKAGVENI